MSSEWKEITVGEVSLVITKGTTPTTVGHSFKDAGVRFVKVETLTDEGRFIDDKFAYISEQAHSILSRSQLRENDVLFTIAGTIGRTGIVGSRYLPANTNQAVAIVRPVTDIIIPKFLRYVFSNPSFTRNAQSKTVQSVQANFSLGELRKAKFFLPPLKTQWAIVSLLGALDDRITLLRETNATLEAIAQALFKSWFVDFDPVRAKAEGRQPEGMDAATAALFPDSFEESELALVPKGWGFGVLGDLADLNPESWSAKRRPETVAYIDLANAKENVIAEITDYPFDDAPSRARRVLRDGDTIVGTVRPGNRSFAFIANAAENLTGSTGFAVLRPKCTENTEFVYLAATLDASIDHLTHIADGGAYPAVRPEVVAGLSTVLPPIQILMAFHEIAKTLFVRLTESHEQAQTLTQLRDTLLPRLISGKLRLPEAETILEKAL
ncbi:restriction modification system DNA specificity domain-containing protein [Pseudomonas saudimassiliensis]|uniref:Restriction modification system DNA specificity domain-containing protein n=1 Tax=Pseudomonas saudimassiliensis TaxID=1461581 RepID=A0A078MLP9_9PSED|nr:restriction endonuclease subunit S [Pseudomonas saudimassiliensis]CEA06367.1 restriction modification system DNA specificity domain-containing protein [Pseudomonas saudimassiliensis]CEF27792.1 restriction modification system DNA specificity domain-containing protein [Pseudomonas saudimassiliensis]